MKWSNVEPDIRPLTIHDAFGEQSAGSTVHLIAATKKTPFILLSNKVKTEIMTHIRSMNTELGGLLLGEVITVGSLEDNIIAVRVTGSVASANFQSTSVSLSMGTDVWEAASKSSDKHKFVVGWYHSHPNLGAFFSGTDRKTQKEFFNSKYSLGLVIDPIRGEECIFIGETSELIPDEYIKVSDELALV